jgi:hypothetical protein
MIFKQFANELDYHKHRFYWDNQNDQNDQKYQWIVFMNKGV